jgi:ketosteroid isomerase-like protein
MKRHNIEFLWAWFDALRRRDTEAMAAVLGVRAPDLGEIDSGEMYNVFTIEEEKITRIEDYLRRDDALAAAGLT